MFSLFSNKLFLQRQQHLSAIREELAGRWDLSRTFTLPGEGEGNVLIELINRIFSRLHLFVVELTKGNVATATVAPLTQAIAGQVRRSSESLAREVEQIEATCRSLATDIGTSADSAGQALEQSAVIVDAIDQTSQLTGQALQRMQSMEQEVARLSVAIGELDQRSRSIGTIIESISDIADHTGLLSLNAFIEAARAKEHGAGFGVIAQEIRQLSQESARSAQEVKALLLDISALIQQTVTAVDRVQEEVVTGLEGNRMASASLDQVSAKHRQFHHHLTSVIGAVSSQKQAVGQLAGDLATIATIGQEGRKDSVRLAELADRIKQLTDQQLQATGIFILPQYRKAEQAVLALAALPAICQLGVDTDQTLEQGMLPLGYLELVYLTDTNGLQISSNVLRSGQAITRDATARGKDWSRRDWFRKVRETGRPYISELYKSAATDTFCLTIAVPVYRGEAWVGVLGADINFEHLLTI
ncbi:methyl-accepting chemotaxis sensory transducer with Cache sensor [Desulfobulbus propionicus DSM 2032]|uniref:Methyl-accepting chemotaxis sensory transducer with Cache sensor n=1 Tax=Desulfobulbus propionicus (strain ATCC 33891 / DSM 2032 / VKM B-1956 / 1pr3) TaxID=577650 RepID=A0A7U4DPB3_DESPD|nr:methyl-accepting chemotaxis protein [Desulfobulbus propionicus]ADW17874.1 methyl-accepting chemotaxis sensory transducer with Cache sensor [Desulfobulbus propionicus DSM 2032]